VGDEPPRRPAEPGPGRPAGRAIRRRRGTGKPVVVLLFSGRPASIRRIAERADAILELWYLGQETGSAVANVLFGDVNPGGKLPITVPRSAGHVPAYYNHKPSARRGYLFDSVARSSRSGSASATRRSRSRT